MLNYEETIDEFRKGDLEIDCRAMTLTQRKINGEVYTGKGYIRQAESGALQFKLYVVETSNVTPFESFSRHLSIQAGTLHPEEVFYDLSATTHDGTMWAAEKLLPSFSWDVQDVEAIALGQIADGLVLVLEANATRRESALRIAETLRATQIRVLGAVLNKRTFPIPEGLYNRL